MFRASDLRSPRPLMSARTWKERAVPAAGCFAALLFVAYVRHLHPATHGLDMAYIGPGAGFAFLGSFLSLVAGGILAAFSIVTWPIRVGWRALRRGRTFRNAKVKRIIFLGLDGLDPRLTERFMAEGKLPNLAKLASTGG